MSATAAIENPRPLVHVAILRTVREGREAEFEAKITAFFGKTAGQPGVSGAYLIRPVAGSNTREYGILRTFQSESDMQHFYDSEVYARWKDEVRPLVEGEPQKRRLHGLEAFFRGSEAPPPEWKMALITWLGVNVAVYIVNTSLAAMFGPVPMLAGLLIGNALVVASLTWILMPALTRIFRPWLQPGVS
jgi:uncharacterized protein